MQKEVIASFLRRGGVGLGNAGGHSHASGLSCKSAFTLAEVLITLGIIGVVAAMTMPQLIRNYERKAAEVQIKKDYSTLANALQMAENEYGRLEDWTIDNPDKADDEYFKRLAKYLQLAYEPCYDRNKCYYEKVSSYTNGVYFRLKDGTYGIFQDNGRSNGGHKAESPKQFFKLYTHGYYIRYSILNLRSLKINSSVSCSKPICYFSTVPDCPKNSAAWTDYKCSIKFASDGFSFKDENVINQLKVNMRNMNFKARGWQ